jgi:hypothetical protein
MGDFAANNNPPNLALLLLKFVTPATFKDYLIADLHEEFDERAAINVKKAKIWYWKQAITSTYQFSKLLFTTAKLVNLFILIIAPVIFILLLMTITGISHMDNADPLIMSYILKGQVHNLLLNDFVLSIGYERFVSVFSLDIYYSSSALYWCLLSLVMIAVLNAKLTLTRHIITLLSCALMLAPYFGGLLYIGIMDPEQSKIGGIMAFMVFPIVYMLLPIVVWINTPTKNF